MTSILCLYLLSLQIDVDAATIQARMSADLNSGKPLIAHITAALCDNRNQGIVPVPAKLGNGQNPRTNLYWGALYGVRTHLTGKAGWIQVKRIAKPEPHLLERLILHTTIRRNSKDVDCYIVADAWDGAHMEAALTRFSQQASGRKAATIQLQNQTLDIGGAAHLQVFVGHNGLMELRDLTFPKAAQAPPRASAVPACVSKMYFQDKLQKSGSLPLVLTTQFMAPEAYTVDALIRAWFAGDNVNQTRQAAANAYNQYQKCGQRGARRLFDVQP